MDMVKSLKPEYSKLNQPVPDSDRRKVKRQIEKWKEEGIVSGYFAFLIANLTRYTYANVLEILVYGIYLSKNKKLYSLSRRIFTDAIQDCYDQGREELGEEKKLLKWDEITPLLMIPSLNESYKDYQYALSVTEAQEMNKELLVMLRGEIPITEYLLMKFLIKQANRILKVNKDKYSGAIVDVTRSAGNLAYVKASEKDQEVKFVAEMDDRTTKMCRSLDGQIFHTKEWNVFYRYSEFYQAKHKFSCKGLQVGLNLPPINDHFHWCRSTVTYQI